MFKKIVLFFLCAFMMGTAAQAQSWSKLKKEGEEAYAEGRLAEAAEKYEQAFSKKRNKEELIFQAAEIYYTLRDYRKAAESYRFIKDKNDKFPLVGLKYARCLKQDGQYDPAKEAFDAFMENYTGQGKEILEDIIRIEKQGCTLGMEAPAQANRDVEILLPGSGVNSDKEEFAPFPVSDNELFFSSSLGDRARIYTSRREGQNWSKAEPPRNFPVIQRGQFGNGTMTPDGSRYYFTICSSDTKAWNDIRPRCEIFVTKRVGAIWSQPERLADYINTEGVTATHPCVIHERGQELLFFASNREGGRGGMDLWYVTRDLGTDDNDFTFPINLGPVVNTLGDEVTPYYDMDDQNLYFASNGHISMGGFDVFRSNGDEVSWSQPENMGMPINSSADDYFYILNPSRTGGFLVSNRVYAGGKNTTTHQDIFEFAVGGRRTVVKGNVYDRQSGETINDISVSLFQVFEDGRETPLINKDFNEGNYSFEILPERRFRVEVSAYGYVPGSYRFSANDPNTFIYGQPLFLEAENSNNQIPTPPKSDDPDDDPVNVPPSKDPRNTRVDTPENTPYIARGRNPNDNAEYQTSAPRHNGTYYKIQLAAVGTYVEDKFSDVQPLGRLDTELILGRGLTRVLVADFFSLEEARSALTKVKEKGYSSAYIVEYIDGERYGKAR
ncbi:MAG TPA: hypothetical protein PKA00_11310 [Saprospiraceae bacterium]|nr:hypothetical protein [Saprospiraceae bacterium]HMQ83490.1 hypothetical protein [Saprospiraceae bacterium]